ncbi:major facilitator family transporter, partial [Reticulomyxa filosa]
MSDLNSLKDGHEQLLNESGKDSALLDKPAQEKKNQRRPPKFRPPRKKKSTQSLKMHHLWTDPAKRVSLYVLFVDRYLIGVTASNMQQSQGWGNGEGTGKQFDMLVGPVFSAVYIPMGIVFGMMADRMVKYRNWMLVAALLTWSLACVCTGLSTTYTEVVCARIVLALAQAACTPLAGAIITEFFPKSIRATALGIYGWGVYIGYSLTVGAANAMTSWAGWRAVWYAFGFAGIVWCIFVGLLPRPLKTRRREFTQSYEGKKKLSVSFSLNDSAGGRNQQYSQLSAPPSRESSVEPAYNAEDKGVQLLEVLRYFALTPAIWLLCSAAMIRQAAGLIWAYNSKDFFSDVRDQSNYQQSVFMLWIPALFGCLGSVYGGYVSDNYVKHASNSKRLIILVFVYVVVVVDDDDDAKGVEFVRGA